MKANHGNQFSNMIKIKVLEGKKQKTIISGSTALHFFTINSMLKCDEYHAVTLIAKIH